MATAVAGWQEVRVMVNAHTVIIGRLSIDYDFAK
jgi:hypothetical protein